MATLKLTPRGIELYSRYDPDLVAGIKRIPWIDRMWDNDNKRWVVSHNYQNFLVALCQQLGMPPTLQGQDQQPALFMEMHRIEYIGLPKDRGGESLSSATPDGKSWNIIFPELVMREWFDGEKNVSVSTYYGLLAIKNSADVTAVKKAYRTMSKRYHPDVNKDDDAQDMFIKIKEAYEVLRNPMMRKRYDAGLVLQQSVYAPNNYQDIWKPPVRCGNILCDGQYRAGRFVVQKIHQWLDIVQGNMMLVTSWDRHSNRLVREWI